MPSDSDANNTAGALEEFLLSLANDRNIYDIDDLIETVTRAIPAQSFLCVVFTQRRAIEEIVTSDSENPRLLFNYISFFVSNEHIGRFENRHEVATYVAALEKRTDILVLRNEACDIYASANLSHKLISRIQLACTAFFLLSDPYIHYIENTARRLARHGVREEDKGNDLPGIARFISSRFDIDVGFVAVRNPVSLDLTLATERDFSFQFFAELSKKTLSSAHFLNNAIRALARGNDYSGRISADETNTYYKLLPVSIPSRLYNLSDARSAGGGVVEQRRYFPVGALALISRGKRIDRICYITAKELVREIAGTKRIAEQLRKINDLHAGLLKMREQLTRFPLLSHSQTLKFFSEYADEVTKSLVEFTAAHSATVRLYDPFRGALKPISSYFSSSLSSPSRLAKDISVVDKTSVNAFVFSKVGDEPFYVADFRENLESGGGAGVAGLAARPETESELCIQLRKGGVPIGTMNIESPYSYALGKDILYCEALARLIGEFFDVATRTSDAAWLPKISLSHLVHHRIEKVRREQPSLVGVLDFIENPIRRQEPGDGGRVSVTLRGLLAEVVATFDWLNQDTLKQLVRNNLSQEITLRREAASSLAIILETLIENCRTHSPDIAKDKIAIGVVSGASRPRGEIANITDYQLSIAYTSRTTRTTLELLDQLTVAPVWEDDDRSYHFGMFLLGAHARLLGGAAYVDSDPVPGRNSRPLRVVVNLPLATIASI